MRSPSHWSAAHAPAATSAAAATLTWLEINGWIITAGGVTVLVDPILEGGLDFGIPSIYSAQKRSLPASGLLDALPPRS